MNLENLFKQPWIGVFFALSLLAVLIVTALSRQRKNGSPQNLNGLQTITTTVAPITSKPLISTSKVKYKISGPISLNGVSNMTISGDSINCNNTNAIGIKLTNCHNIHITHCKIYNSTANGIYLYKCSNITIETCYITKVSTGINVSTSLGIVIKRNQMKNMLGPMPGGQFVQFNTVGGANNMVANNVFENIMGSSYPEDAISMYMTNGTAASPVMISGNRIRGGGPSTTGGGINLGDDGGSYQIAENNVLVNPGQYGMAVSGGTNMKILNNKIYAAQNTFSNVGISVWNQYTNISASSGITVSGNQVNWTNSAGKLNSCWNAGNCGTVTGWGSNTWGANIKSSILHRTIITLN
jgi:parallel beta-helix repeat protein